MKQKPDSNTVPQKPEDSVVPWNPGDELYRLESNPLSDGYPWVIMKYTVTRVTKLRATVKTGRGREFQVLAGAWKAYPSPQAAVDAKIEEIDSEIHRARKKIENLEEDRCLLYDFWTEYGKDHCDG